MSDLLLISFNNERIAASMEHIQEIILSRHKLIANIHDDKISRG